MSAIIGGSTRSTPWIRTLPAKMREAHEKTRKRKLDPVRFAASSRKDLIRELTQPGPGRSRHTRMTVTESISAVDRWKSSPPGSHAGRHFSLRTRQRVAFYGRYILSGSH